MTLKKPKAILFDWDNTLVNTWPIIHQALHNTFVELGQEPWTYDQTRERVRKSMRDSFPEVFGERWEEAGKKYLDHYMSNHIAMLEAYPMAEEVLQHLRDMGIYLAVVSNKRGPSLRKEAEHLGWGKYFDKLIGSQDADKDKPAPDPVLMALEGSGIEMNEDVWLIGDSEIDLECAKNCGIIPVLYGEALAHHMDDVKKAYFGFSYHAHYKDHVSLGEALRALK